MKTLRMMVKLLMVCCTLSAMFVTIGTVETDPMVSFIGLGFTVIFALITESL